MIRVDAYSFLNFSDLTCHLENTGIGVPPDTKDTELGSSDQEVSPSSGKNTRIVLMPCRAWKCVPTAISGSVDMFEVSGCHLLRQISSQ